MYIVLRSRRARENTCMGYLHVHMVIYAYIYMCTCAHTYTYSHSDTQITVARSCCAAAPTARAHWCTSERTRAH